MSHVRVYPIALTGNYPLCRYPHSVDEGTQAWSGWSTRPCEAVLLLLGLGEALAKHGRASQCWAPCTL